MKDIPPKGVMMPMSEYDGPNNASAYKDPLNKQIPIEKNLAAQIVFLLEKDLNSIAVMAMAMA